MHNRCLRQSMREYHFCPGSDAVPQFHCHADWLALATIFQAKTGHESWYISGVHVANEDRNEEKSLYILTTTG